MWNFVILLQIDKTLYHGSEISFSASVAGLVMTPKATYGQIRKTWY